MTPPSDTEILDMIQAGELEVAKQPDGFYALVIKGSGPWCYHKTDLRLAVAYAISTSR